MTLALKILTKFLYNDVSIINSLMKRYTEWPYWKCHITGCVHLLQWWPSVS